MYGGAAGGGKSDALLMAALANVEHPGYAALLLRRTLSDLSLPGALLDRSRQWLSGKDCTFREKTRTWTFKSGATLSFGFLEHDGDQYRYQGSEFQFIGFDECTQFEEYQYRYLFSRLRRRVGAPYEPKMRAASNPGGIGHEWVKQRFIVEGNTKDRAFVPAGLDDNPYLDRESYEAALDQLDPITRAQLKLGDWNAKHGGSIFAGSWFDKIDEWPSSMRLVWYWDLASTEEGSKNARDPDYTVGTLMGRDMQGVYYVLDVIRMRDTPAKVEEAIYLAASKTGRHVPVYIEQEPGSSGVITVDNYARRVLNGYTVSGVRSTGAKGLRAGPFSSQAQRKNVKILRAAWNTAWIDELEAFPEGKHDDQVDSASGAFSSLQQTSWWQDANCVNWLINRSAAEGGSNIRPTPAEPPKVSDVEAAQREIDHPRARTPIFLPI